MLFRHTLANIKQYLDSDVIKQYEIINVCKMLIILVISNGGRFKALMFNFTIILTSNLLIKRNVNKIWLGLYKTRYLITH